MYVAESSTIVGTLRSQRGRGRCRLLRLRVSTSVLELQCVDVACRSYWGVDVLDTGTGDTEGSHLGEGTRGGRRLVTPAKENGPSLPTSVPPPSEVGPRMVGFGRIVLEVCLSRIVGGDPPFVSVPSVSRGPCTRDTGFRRPPPALTLPGILCRPSLRPRWCPPLWARDPGQTLDPTKTLLLFPSSSTFSTNEVLWSVDTLPLLLSGTDPDPGPNLYHGPVVRPRGREGLERLRWVGSEEESGLEEEGSLV